MLESSSTLLGFFFPFQNKFYKLIFFLVFQVTQKLAETSNTVRMLQEKLKEKESMINKVLHVLMLSFIDIKSHNSVAIPNTTAKHSTVNIYHLFFRVVPAFCLINY